MDGRRMYPRYVCAGGVEISVPESNRRLWGHLSDISRNGIYMETAEPWLVGIEVVARIEAANKEIYASAKIVTCHPGVGMGLILLQVYPQFQADFDLLLGQLANNVAEPPPAVVHP